MAGRVGIAVKDIEKSKEQLRDELKILRAQVAELKTSILKNSGHAKSLERGADACSRIPEKKSQHAMRLEALSILAGGVALNRAIVYIMKKLTGREVTVLKDPVHNGAIGCCVNGMER